MKMQDQIEALKSEITDLKGQLESKFSLTDIASVDAGQDSLFTITYIIRFKNGKVFTRRGVLPWNQVR